MNYHIWENVHISFDDKWIAPDLSGGYAVGADALVVPVASTPEVQVAKL